MARPEFTVHDMAIGGEGVGDLARHRRRTEDTGRFLVVQP